MSGPDNSGRKAVGGRPDRWPGIWVWEDGVCRSGAAQMAVDELLLAAAGARPVLRVYRWPSHSASFGYAMRWANAADTVGPVGELVRRWTGGGLVRHGMDFTYSLVIPAELDGGLDRRATYCRVHRAVADLIGRTGVRADLVADDGTAVAGLGGDCFQRPAVSDVLVGGEKVAGAGQRRTRAGVLHQGSVAAGAPAIRAEDLAAALARVVEAMPVSLCPSEDAVDALAARRYAHADWTRQR